MAPSSDQATAREAGHAVSSPSVPPQIVPAQVPVPGMPVTQSHVPPGQQMNRPTKVAFGVIVAVMVISAIAIAVDHLDRKKPSLPRHSIASTTVASTSATATTAAQDTPVDLDPSAADSAAALVSSWAAGNRTTALLVATPSAVASLFSVPYRNGFAIDRGCSVAFSPIVCTYGPPGGAPPTDEIFEIDVLQTSKGWYVSAVKIYNSGQ
jgi:hypothetical protein